ncbi:hypothetical protein U9M48_005051 [Paspalum notatum var. saurae]|uniref:Leucine-rich repeat-containing N-terminal plant-type domain-containing protein n=1 Tax=Paspalum notatum var. saurae TaxID=547442 RepID=A0AAQ3PW09_PASNO
MDGMVFIITWLLILSSLLCLCSGSNSNVQCLKDLKQSLDDPNGALSSWNFSRTAMEGHSLSQFAGVTGWPGDDNRVMLLNLSSMGLQGSFPRGLQLCTVLASLDLRNNSLSGPLPADISLQMSYVKYLDLSHNRFSGEIPQDISRWLMFIVFLDLSNNRPSGEIPHTIADLLFLNTLNLQCNLLTCQIPEQIGYLGWLNSLNLSD